jgi:succinate dehydrogenase / fumarate reductase membrane anchor subunit
MNYRTPLRNVRGLGSARGGARHWWMQRVTALALIPLVFWFALALADWPAVSHMEFVRWVSQPWNTILLLSFIPAVFYHAMLGIQVIIEDYVHTDWIKIMGILAMKLLLSFLALASVFAVLRIVFQG